MRDYCVICNFTEMRDLKVSGDHCMISSDSVEMLKIITSVKRRLLHQWRI